MHVATVEVERGLPQQMFVAKMTRWFLYCIGWQDKSCDHAGDNGDSAATSHPLLSPYKNSYHEHFTTHFLHHLPTHPVHTSYKGVKWCTEPCRLRFIIATMV